MDGCMAARPAIHTLTHICHIPAQPSAKNLFCRICEISLYWVHWAKGDGYRFSNLIIHEALGIAMCVHYIRSAWVRFLRQMLALCAPIGRILLVFQFYRPRGRDWDLKNHQGTYRSWTMAAFCHPVVANHGTLEADMAPMQCILTRNWEDIQALKMAVFVLGQLSFLRMPGWSYSYYVIFVFVRPSRLLRMRTTSLRWSPLCRCEVWGGLGTCQWRGSWHVWLVRVWVSWFVRLLPAIASQTMPVLSTVEAQLSLHEHDIAKDTQKHANAKKTAAIYEWAKAR